MTKVAIGQTLSSALYLGRLMLSRRIHVRRVNPYYLGEPSRLFSHSSNPSVPLRITTDPSCSRRLYRDAAPTIPYSIPNHSFSSSYQVGQPPVLSLSHPGTPGTGVPSLGDLLSPDYHRRLGHSSTFTQISPNIVKVNKDMFCHWFGLSKESISSRDGCALSVNR